MPGTTPWSSGELELQAHQLTHAITWSSLTAPLCLLCNGSQKLCQDTCTLHRVESSDQQFTQGEGVVSFYLQNVLTGALYFGSRKKIQARYNIY